MRTRVSDINEIIKARTERAVPSDASVISAFEQSSAAATGLSPQAPLLTADIFTSLIHAGNIIPPWWSRARDKALSDFWKDANHLSIALYNAQSKLVGIPLQVVARDPTKDADVAQAEEMTYMLHTVSEFGKSWGVAYAKFIEDLLTQDNGAFMEILGGGPPDGPIVGQPIAVRHLDSSRCTRTTSPEYPVVYLGEDDRRYKIYWTRLVSMAQMPSARSSKNGVGLCAVSRAIDIARTLVDVMTYKQEKLGSRPSNMILIGKGVTGEQIMEALYQGEIEADNAGRSRYAKTVTIGSEDTDIDVTKLELNHLDPFDEETAITLGMFAIAGAFGLDASELWPTQTGTTNKADSALRRLRSRGKLPAQTTADLEAQFNFKLLPPHLMVKFDFQDDEEDQQRANIRDIRGRNRERDLGSGTLDERSARVMMVDDGDLDRTLFEQMEMADGRLPDGTSIATLFYAEDPVYSRHLRFEGIEPLIIAENDPWDAMEAIQRNRVGLLKEWATTTSSSKDKRLYMANAALDWLEDQYREMIIGIMPEIPFQQRRMLANVTRLTRTEVQNAPDQSGQAGNVRATPDNQEQRDQAGSVHQSNEPGDRARAEGNDSPVRQNVPQLEGKR